MAKNYKKAVLKTAKQINLDPEFIIDNELVLEYNAEYDLDEFTAWFDKNEKRVKPGTPIGYTVNDNATESCIYPYEGLEERDVNSEDVLHFCENCSKEVNYDDWDKDEHICRECSIEYCQNNNCSGPFVEKFECPDCGVYYWVENRNEFECPNCLNL